MVLDSLSLPPNDSLSLKTSKFGAGKFITKSIGEIPKLVLNVQPLQNESIFFFFFYRKAYKFRKDMGASIIAKTSHLLFT